MLAAQYEVRIALEIKKLKQLEQEMDNALESLCQAAEDLKLHPEMMEQCVKRFEREDSNHEKN